MSRSVVILGAARTPIGKYGGSFKDVHPAELGAVAARAAVQAAGIGPADIEDVWIGHGRQAGSGPNPARQVGHRAGIPHATPAQTVNKACASGVQAIVSGARGILLGEADVVLAGGIESMSRMPYLVDSVDARWGHKMGHFQFVDAMYRDGFQCPISNLIMGETSEVLARQYGITREQSDVWRQIEGVTRGRYSVGQGNQQDVLRTQVELTRVGQALAEQEAEAAVSRVDGEGAERTGLVVADPFGFVG